MDVEPREAVVVQRLRAALPAGARFWTDLAGITGWRQRLRFARTNLFPSAAYLRQRYAIPHPLLVPLYYPYRWWRGLRGSFALRWLSRALRRRSPASPGRNVRTGRRPRRER
jgi:hypothetical protein